MLQNVIYTADNRMSRFYGDWEKIWEGVFNTDASRGYRDYKLHEEFPVLQRYHLHSEMEFAEGHYWTLANRKYWWTSIAGASIYLILVYWGQKFMYNRKPHDLKKLLGMWNFLLAAFSIIGTTRLVSHLLYGLLINHHTYFFCRAAGEAYGQGPAGLWANMFVWSKFLELFDTAFLVLRKKPVNFLHWFHHASVLILCWHAGQYQMPTGIFFASMNYVVHSVMYVYYFLAAVTKPPKWGKFVTIIQLLQMFIGMFITIYHYYLLETLPNCDGSYANLTFALGVYTAYMALFMEYFISRYIRAKRGVNTTGSESGELKKSQ
jgi:hypothetical protein